MLNNPNVSIYDDINLDYPFNGPFNPPKDYPEYIFSGRKFIIEAHEKILGTPDFIAADKKYGSEECLRYLQEKGIKTAIKPKTTDEDIFQKKNLNMIALLMIMHMDVTDLAMDKIYRN